MFSEAIKRVGLAFLDVLQTVVLAAAMSMVVYLFVLQPHQVKGQSMMPGFHDGEYLLTDKISYRLGSPNRGDVVIIKAPPTEWCAERNCEYIKRIVAMGGDNVLLKDGRVYLNGELLGDDYLPEGKGTNPGGYLKDGAEVTIPAGMYLVMGDNRLHSRDGREFGPVPRSSVIGKAWVRYWPPSAAGIIPQYHF